MLSDYSKRCFVNRILPTLLFVAVVVGAWAAESQPPASGPRGKPIRPPASLLTNTSPFQSDARTVMTLPGGVVITNVPQEFLPRTTNIVRLNAVAARKFEPLGYLPISFMELARFFLTVPTSGPKNDLTPDARWQALRQQIPQDVLALDGKKVAIVGFTLPLTFSNGWTTEFLLLRTQAACCFGMVPRVNELIMVKMAAPGMRPVLDTPVIVGGKLTVKWIGAGDQLAAVYEMLADKIAPVSGD